jgi:hypothetical protein
MMGFTVYYWSEHTVQCNHHHQPGSRLDVTVPIVRTEPLPTDCLMTEHCSTPTSLYISVPCILFMNLKCQECVMQANGFKYHKNWWHFHVMLYISSHTHTLKKSLLEHHKLFDNKDCSFNNTNIKIHLETWSWVTFVKFASPNINFKLIPPHA